MMNIPQVTRNDKNSSSDFSSSKVTSTPVLSTLYDMEINESYECIYIPPNITPKNVSPVPMQLVEGPAEKRGILMRCSVPYQVMQFPYHLFLEQTMKLLLLTQQ